ncbi:hypothetical protein LJK88_21105 [Paenibacillus sp. P26]|nr:hypothetical protein LJK88_21105 [Paenibacillus sp. P26]UUZ95887.1 hypothetical protein LJK87_16775 [Paenibacillus sp. P25]
MSVLNKVLQDIPIPQVVRIRQKFDETKLERPEEVLIQELKKPGAIDQIKPGQQVAVAVGDRG